MEKILYHSFMRGQTDEKSWDVFLSILNNGLLLTPEKLRLPVNIYGTLEPPLVTRICFTALDEAMIGGHSEKFGNFSIGWDLKFLQKLGVMPVWYLPIWTKEGDNQTVGNRILLMLLALHQDARTQFLSSTIDDDISHLSKRVCDTLEVIEGLIYPVDNQNRPDQIDFQNSYYMQHEWKLLGNITCNSQYITNELTSLEKLYLMEMDEVEDEDEDDGNCESKSLLRKKIVDGAGDEVPYLSRCRLLKMVEGRHILSFAKVIIVPRQYYREVITIKDKYNFTFDVKIFEELNI